MRKGILDSMRYAPPVVAPKTSDESPPIACAMACDMLWFTSAYTPRMCLRNAPARTLAKTYYSGPGRSLPLIVVARGRYR